MSVSRRTLLLMGASGVLLSACDDLFGSRFAEGRSRIYRSTESLRRASRLLGWTQSPSPAVQQLISDIDAHERRLNALPEGFLPAEAISTTEILLEAAYDALVEAGNLFVIEGFRPPASGGSWVDAWWSFSS